MRGLRKWRFEFRTQLSQPAQQVTLRWHDFAPDRITDPLDPPPLPVTGEIQAQGLVDPFMLTPAEPAYTSVPILRWSWRSLGNLSNPNRSGQPHLGGAALWLRSVNGGHAAAVAAFNTPLSRGAGVSVSLGLAVVMVRTPHRELPVRTIVRCGNSTASEYVPVV